MLRAAAGSIRDLVARLRGDGGGERQEPAAPVSRRLEPATLAALRLERQPFRDDTPAEALFSDDAIDMQLNVLTTQLDEGEMLPVLKGEDGSGKTTLLILLMARSSDRFHYFIARGRRELTAERIIVDMLRMFTRETPGQVQQSFRELARRLRRLVADDCPAVLVVDDADAMSDAQLNNLLAMHDSLGPALGGRFRLLLSTGADFEPRLARLQSRQLGSGRVMAAGVRPLARPRLGAYLEHRLQAAGYAGATPFDEAALDRIAARGGSLPRGIEAAAAAELNAAAGPA